MTASGSTSVDTRAATISSRSASAVGSWNLKFMPRCTPTAMRGSIDDVAWDLHWEAGKRYEHVHPLIQRLGVATVPQGKVDSTIESAEECPGECIFIEA